MDSKKDIFWFFVILAGGLALGWVLFPEERFVRYVIDVAVIFSVRMFRIQRRKKKEEHERLK